MPNFPPLTHPLPGGSYPRNIVATVLDQRRDLDEEQMSSEEDSEVLPSDDLVPPSEPAPPPPLPEVPPPPPQEEPLELVAIDIPAQLVHIRKLSLLDRIKRVASNWWHGRDAAVETLAHTFTDAKGASLGAAQHMRALGIAPNASVQEMLVLPNLLSTADDSDYDAALKQIDRVLPLLRAAIDQASPTKEAIDPAVIELEQTLRHQQRILNALLTADLAVDDDAPESLEVLKRLQEAPFLIDELETIVDEMAALDHVGKLDPRDLVEFARVISPEGFHLHFGGQNYAKLKGLEIWKTMETHYRLWFHRALGQAQQSSASGRRWMADRTLKTIERRGIEERLAMQTMGTTLGKSAHLRLEQELLSLDAAYGKALTREHVLAVVHEFLETEIVRVELAQDEDKQGRIEELMLLNTDWLIGKLSEGATGIRITLGADVQKRDQQLKDLLIASCANVGVKAQIGLLFDHIEAGPERADHLRILLAGDEGEMTLTARHRNGQIATFLMEKMNTLYQKLRQGNLYAQDLADLYESTVSCQQLKAHAKTPDDQRILRQFERFMRKMVVPMVNLVPHVPGVKDAIAKLLK